MGKPREGSERMAGGGGGETGHENRTNQKHRVTVGRGHDESDVTSILP